MVEHQHHEHEHGTEGQRRDTLISAVTAAVLAVCAAIGSLLSGHAANDAVLNQSRANDQWALYQAKSTKGHLYEANQEVLDTLATLQGARREQVQPKLDDFKQKVAKYEKDKEKTKKDAEELEVESRTEFQKHQRFSLGVAAFQIGIVLASISILVRNRVIYALSLVAGCGGLVFVLLGILLVAPPPSSGSSEGEQHASVCWPRSTA
jgi:Skp family chaperone for outer membrane proteins